MAVRRLPGHVPQQLSADSGLTGHENVALFARVFDVSRRERAGRVDQALCAGGLTEAADRLAGTCSGGVVRRLELAQALVGVPRLLRRHAGPLILPRNVMCGTPLQALSRAVGGLCLRTA